MTYASPMVSHLARWALDTYAGNLSTCGMVAFAWLCLCWLAGRPESES